MTEETIYNTTNKLIMQLQEYVKLEGTELGEACDHLCSLHCYTGYISEKFERALAREIAEQLKNFKEYSEIVTREETTTHTSTHVELIWND